MLFGFGAKDIIGLDVKGLANVIGLTWVMGLVIAG